MQTKVLALLLGSAAASCGSCINAGSTFCYQGDTEGVAVADAGSMPTAHCCTVYNAETGTCTTDGGDQDVSSGFVCSNGYTDTDYAKEFCPQRQDACGSNQSIEFAEETETPTDISITGLANGETCTYKVKATCGAPGMKKNDESTTASTTYDVVILTVDADNADANIPEGGDKPARDTSFADWGNGGEINGQRRPPYQKDGAEIEGEGLAPPEGGSDLPPPPRDSDGNERPPPPRQEQETDSVGGYGKPTKMAYDSTQGGYAMYGVQGQGQESKGIKREGGDRCAPREMAVTVTAT